MSATDDAARLERMEMKLDRLGEGMERLARIEERQTAHLDRQARLEERQDAIDKRVGELEKDKHQATPFIGLLRVAAVAAVGALVATLMRDGDWRSAGDLAARRQADDTASARHGEARR